MQLQTGNNKASAKVNCLTRCRNIPFVKSVTESHYDRPYVERFIHQGFARHYDADVRHFMPLLVSLESKELQAALGIRLANQPLFIEQYLSESFDAELSKRGFFAPRCQLAEIGNLYSQSSMFTSSLLLAASAALYLAGVRYVAFSATIHVRKLLQRQGIELTFLADADKARLGESQHHWGSYYDTQPHVVLMDLNDVAALIAQSPRLSEQLSMMALPIENIRNDLEVMQCIR